MLIFVCLPSAVFAEYKPDWHIDFSAGVGFDDNPTLTSEKKLSGNKEPGAFFLFGVRPSVNLWKDDKQRVDLDVKVLRLQRLGSASDEFSITQTGGNLGYSNRMKLGKLDTDLFLSLGGNVTLLGDEIYQQDFNLGGKLSFFLTPDWKITPSMGFQVLDIDDKPFNARQNTRSGVGWNAGLQLSHQFNRHTSLTANLKYKDFEAKGSRKDYQSKSFDIRLDHKLYEYGLPADVWVGGGLGQDKFDNSNRKDNPNYYTVGMLVYFRHSQTVRLSWRLNEKNSNTSFFDNKRNVVLVNYNWRF